MKRLVQILFRNFLILFRKPLSWLFLRDPIKLKGYQKNFKDTTLTAMVPEFNVFHRWIYEPFFRRVKVVHSDITKIRAVNGPTVFVLKNKGKLEYRYFNHLFLKEKIPSVQYATHYYSIFWWPFRTMLEQLICKLDHFYRTYKDGPFDGNKHVEELLKSGKNVWLNLTISRDYLFGMIRSDPMDIIQPLLDIQQNLDRPIHVVPIQFLYDKHPDKTERTYFDLLFGEKSKPGAIRKFILFCLNYRSQPQVNFSDPIDLKEFLANDSSDMQAHGTRLLKQIESDLQVEKAKITGPLLMPKEQMIKAILKDEDFNNKLSMLAGKDDKKKAALKKDAKRYLNEIAADAGYSFVHFVHITVSYLWNRIYNGVVVKHEQLNRVREVAGKNPIVLVPMHRSHIDYLLISDLFYERNITFPHICAGINLNFWPVGRLIRKAGGFFIRRTFKGNETYRESVYSYIKRLLSFGYCIEFFIEGTRSRTGKLLKPKMGILSMLMRAYFEKACEDIHFVPIAINYDQIIEGQVYKSEGKGEEKAKESASELLKARKVVKSKYGKVYIEFGEPLSFKQYCEDKEIKPRNIDLMRTEVKDFAYYLTYNINRIAIVTPMALVSLAILSLNKHSFSAKALSGRIQLLKDYLDFKDVVFSDLINYSDQYAYNETIKKLCDRHVLKEVETFEGNFYAFEDKHRDDLDYYKNNILHFFVSQYCCLKALYMLKDQSSIALNDVAKKFETIKTLLRHDFTFSERDTLKEHLIRVLDYAQSRGFLVYNPESEMISLNLSEENHDDFNAYQSLLDNFLEANLIAMRYFKHQPVQKLDAKTLVKEMLVKAKPMYLKDELTHPEALSKFNLQNTLKVCVDLGILNSEEKSGKVIFSSAGEEKIVDEWIATITALLKEPMVIVTKSLPSASIETSSSIDLH